MPFKHLPFIPRPAWVSFTVAACSVDGVNLRGEQHKEDRFLVLYSQFFGLKNYESFIFLLLYLPSLPHDPGSWGSYQQETAQT